MKRRDVLKKTYYFLSASIVAPQFVQIEKLHAADCAYMSDEEVNAHFEGLLPAGVVSALSDTGTFHHFHYLHIPKFVLETPPIDGFTTLSSMMVADLGIDDYFFAIGSPVPMNIDSRVRRQFHCHEVFISNAQLQSIQKGNKVEVVAFILSGGEPTKNHTFIFNDTVSLEEKEIATQNAAVSEDIPLDRKRLKCNVAKHGGVRVFSGSGETVINNVQTLKDIIQGH